MHPLFSSFVNEGIYSLLYSLCFSSNLLYFVQVHCIFSRLFCLYGFLSFFLSEFEIFPHFAFKYMNCRIYSSNKNCKVQKMGSNCHLQCYCRPHLFSLDFVTRKYKLLYSHWKRVFIGTSACLHDFSH